MRESFQRFFMMSEPEVLTLEAQAERGPEQEPERSQFSHLVRHFLARFFNHETASPEGDAKTRMVLIAVATGLPGFVVALYLWPVYHPFIDSLQEHGPILGPPYWLRVNHHFFFVVYSFVAMGIVTVFEWDMFFPDLLDLYVLTTLPIPARRLFLARIAAIAILMAGFLFDANVFAPLVLPAAIDPPNLLRFLAGHLLAVAGSGLFAAVLLLALQGMLLSVLGERVFRKFSLVLQGLSITALLMLLLLFPVISGTVPVLLQSGSAFARFFPPFWFLGVYQRLMEGPSALPIYTQLAQTGCLALLVVTGLAALAYPIAYLRRVRQLVIGPGTHSAPSWVARPLQALINAILVRRTVRRAVFHFISETLMRVQRYRIYLVLYGGVGLSVVIAAIFRLAVVHGQIRAEVSSDGIRAAVGIVAFWTIAGLRMAFVSPGNRQGSWVFHSVHGRPAPFQTAIDQLLAAKTWAFLWGLIISLGSYMALRVIAPPELCTVRATASQLLVTAGMSVLLTDIFFLNVKFVAFTGERTREQPNFAFTIIKYIAFVPAVAWLTLISEPWIETKTEHFIVAAIAIATAHLVLRRQHRAIIREHCNMPGLEDDEEEFPMKLGLRN
ncbi:hypothetical protein [Granulicella sp. L60]|uniref:hypothetical protein n=1 Tax=Granulicella sp. L60 TaxID=1641866 RepID=UPI00131B4162|nr:hypothetical protein [Granulicella sp. L60]